MKKSKTYIKLYLAYIAVLLVPIFVGIIIYTYSLSTIRDQGAAVNLGMLEMVRSEVDQKVDEIGKIAQRIALDEDVQQAAWVKEQFRRDNQMVLYRIYRSLNNITVSERLIQDVFVYFNQTDYVSSMRGNMAGSLYYSLYYDNPNFTFQEFQEYMEKNHFKDMKMIYGRDGKKTMLFTMTNYGMNPGECTATVVIAVNVQVFQELLDTMKWNEDMNILIFCDNDSWITSNGGKRFVTSLANSQLPEADYQKKELLGELCALAVRNSKISGWKYITVIPEHIFEDAAIRIWNYAILGLIACILLGCMISHHFARKHYNPIMGLLNLFHAYTKQPIKQGENELLWLKHQTEQFFMEKKDTDRILLDNQKRLKNYYLSQLLTGSFCGTAEMLSRYGISLPEGNFLVILLQPEPWELKEQQTDEIIVELEFRRFIIGNIFYELISKHYTAEMAEIGGMLAAVICAPKAAEAYDSRLCSCIEQVRDITEKKFSFRTIALVGDCCCEISGIHTSYQHARELEEYVQLLEEDMLFFEDVKNRQTRFDYFEDTEKKIINAIKVGNGILAKQYVEQVFLENISSDVSADTIRYLIFELAKTLLKSAEAAGSSRFARTLDLANFFSRKISVEEVKRSFSKAIDSICEEILKEQKKNEEDNSLSHRVEAYIREAFSDPDLNISIAAQHFDITPSYLSSVYKKQTGRSLLDYITTLRMDRAEELLQEDYTVLEVASMTGFRDSNTFIRSFKKKKGITPGQLKKTIYKKED